MPEMYEQPHSSGPDRGIHTFAPCHQFNHVILQFNVWSGTLHYLERDTKHSIGFAALTPQGMSGTTVLMPGWFPPKAKVLVGNHHDIHLASQLAQM